MFIFLLLCITAVNAGEIRTLVNSKGKKIKVELISRDGEKITFKLVSGFRSPHKKYTVDIATLSDADQEYLKDWEPKKFELPKSSMLDEKKPSSSLYPRSKQEIRAKIKEILKEKGTDKHAKTEQKATNLLNVYRYLCGVPARVKNDSKLNGYCVEAAKICEEKGTLGHNFGHYTDKCNLATDKDIVASVMQYMDDFGDNNREKRGHRWWCLNPTMKKTGFGSGKSGFSAMWSVDGAGETPREKFWSYPGAGYYPKKYMHGTGWSYYQPNNVPPKDKIKVSIYKLKRPPSKRIPLSKEPEGKEIGIKYLSTYKNSIIFEPDHFEAGDSGIYWVRITGGGLRVGYVAEFF